MPIKLENLAVFLLGLVLVFEFAAVFLPQVQVSSDTLGNSGIPLASIFGASGVIILVVVGFLVIRIVKGAKSGMR